MNVTSMPRFDPWSRPWLAYALALLLPLAGTLASQHFPVIAAIPYSPHLLAVVVIVLLGGLLPSIMAAIIALTSRIVLIFHGALSFATLRTEMLHASVLVVAALIVWAMGRRRRHAELGLEDALTALHERNDDLVRSLGSSKCACWIFDLDNGASPRWYGGSYPIFGRPFSELEALPSVLPLVHPEDHPRLAELIAQLRSAPGPIVFEYRCLWPNGELHWLEMRGTRISDRPCVWRGVTLDITERRLAEAALLRAEKLAAMGRLASTVAHEINNPLEAVTNLLYLARSDDALAEPTRSYLMTAEKELARLGNITRLTLGFVRSSGTVTAVDVASTVDDVLSIFQHRFDTQSIVVERHYTPGITVYIAAHELRQIVTNLVANAADAVQRNAARIVISIGRDDSRAILSVADNGSGIELAHLHRIFDPFFSTKEEVGTGIGLWVTRELVEKNAGRIAVETTNLPPGLSTRFRIELPMVPDSFRNVHSPELHPAAGMVAQTTSS